LILFFEKTNCEIRSEWTQNLTKSFLQLIYFFNCSTPQVLVHSQYAFDHCRKEVYDFEDCRQTSNPNPKNPELCKPYSKALVGCYKEALNFIQIFSNFSFFWVFSGICYIDIVKKWTLFACIRSMTQENACSRQMETCTIARLT